MSWLEVDAIVEQCNTKYKNEWERTRWMAYIQALSQGAKLKKPEELITFPWEEKVIEQPELTVTQKEIMKYQLIQASIKQGKIIENIKDLPKSL